MPAKRIKGEPEDDSSAPSASPSPSKKAKTRTKAPWSAEEEARFLEHIDTLCKNGLWQLCKDDEVLKGRGANGVRGYWDSLYKKLSR